MTDRHIKARLARLEAGTRAERTPSPLLVLPPGVALDSEAAAVLAAERLALLGPQRQVIVMPDNGRD